MGNKHKILEIGSKFGRLVVTSHAGVDKRNKTLYNTICECGVNVIAYATELRSGHTKSCGCLRSELSSKRMTTHGATKNYKISKEFSTWCSIKQRCLDKNSKSYENYGGRGIKICDRWLNSFENFLNDMGEKPSNKHSIDRIDVNGNYEPNNCRWATQKEQMRNVRHNVILEYNNTKMTMAEASEKSKIPYYIIQQRIRKGQKDLFDANWRHIGHKLILNTESGVYYENATEAARAHNIKPITMIKQIERKSIKNKKLILV